MRLLSFAVTAATVLLFGFSNAAAEAEAGQGYFSAMASYIDDDNDRAANDEIGGGQFSFGYALDDHWNIELLYQAASLGGLAPQEQAGIGIDFQRVFFRSSRLSPYLFAGFGWFQTTPESALPDDEGDMYAGGAGFNFDLGSSNVSLRGEWRYRVDNAAPTDQHDNLFSLGLQIPFGRGAPKWSDADGDGVGDSSDRCPNTPAGAAVDAFGCELDSDGDGVKDSADQCPDTPRGVAVDSRGCPSDSDGDGVSDDRDKCPNTYRGANVDADGCELDGDGDGVVDRLDECPNTRPGAQVDVKGCEIKEVIRLPGVNFETNSDRLLAGASDVLDDAVATLKRNPTINVEVAGHTDSDGSAAYNEGLSARRAQTVYDYLASNGIAEDRMTVRGYGESQPIADNSTAVGKAQNRRVVLRVTER